MVQLLQWFQTQESTNSTGPRTENSTGQRTEIFLDKHNEIMPNS